jgi:hypothetical protein
MAGASYGGSSQTTSTALPGDTSAYLNQVLPGFDKLGGQATSVISNLLSGLPSASAARTSNAYFGAGSGVGSTSDFLRNRGYDLYGQQAQQRQQTGLQDLLSTIGGYSGTVVPTAGQSLQNTQFGQQLGEQSSEFGQNLQLQQFQAMLQALSLGEKITSSNQTQIPTYSGGQS